MLRSAAKEVSVTDRFVLPWLLVALAACSGGESETTARKETADSANATSSGNATMGDGFDKRSRWSVAGTYEPEADAIPEVVLWATKIEGEFHDPVLDLQTGTRWSTRGTLTATRWPSRQPMGNECTSSVSPNPQVVSLDSTNTRVLLNLGGEDLVYRGAAWTTISYERTVTCPDQAPTSVMIQEELAWLDIPQTRRELTDVVIEGMGASNGGTFTWKLTKLQQ
jgi:hypothetical protein